MTDKRIFEFGQFTLNVGEKTLLRGETDIRLSPKQFDLLLFFVENSKHLLKKEDLLAAIWPGEFIEERNLNKRVGELREKLGRTGRAYIQTVPTRGYRFDAEVEEKTRGISDEDCPWLGLRTFDEADARYYHGRESEIRELVKKLEQHNFLVVVGSSGTGKSSLVRAGLIPALRRGESEWSTIVFRPNSAPLKKLAGRLLLAGGKPTTVETVSALADRLKSHANALLEIIDEIGGGLELKPVLIVVDQFEEVITQCEDPVERQQFVSCLLSVVSAPARRVSVVITVRTDFYPKLQDYPELWSQIPQHQYNVSHVGREQLRQVIMEPARVAGLEVEDTLVGEILDDLGEGAGKLPLLSHAMSELFKRRDGRRLTFAAYRATGKVKETVARHANEVYNEFGPDERELARRIFINLVKVGEDHESDVRMPVPLEDLANEYEPGRKAAVESVVRKLSVERLLTMRGGMSVAPAAQPAMPADRVLVELAHEALIRHWQRLSDWLKPRRRARRIFVSLDISARDWADSGRKSEFLYRGSRLANALDARPEYEELMKPVHHEFIRASEEQVERAREQEERARRREESRRRLRYRFKILVVFAVILGSLFSLAVWKWVEANQQRKLAESYGRAGASAMQEGFDPQLGLLLAIEAGRLAITKDTVAVLRQALASSYVETILQGHKAQVISVAISRDGKSLLTAGADKEARLWDLEKKETIKILAGHTDWVNWAAFSPDGTRAVTASRDGTARIFSLVDDTAVMILRGHKQSVNNAVFSPDGLNVLTAGEDSTARIWDTRTGQLLRTLTGHLKWINTAVYSPDGKLVVTASGDNTARVWDARTEAVLATLKGHTNTVLSASFSPDGKQIITGGSDKSARVWAVGSWEEVRQLHGHTSNVNSVEFSPDSRWILTGSKDGTSQLWNATNGYPVLEFRGHLSGINTAIFSPDGQHVYTASGDHTARIWSVRLPPRIATLDGHKEAVWSASFSRDGGKIITAGKDKSVSIWEARTGRLLMSIPHPAPVQNAVFSPDGNLIATVSSDGVGRLWNAGTGEARGELVGHQQMVHAINFSADGTKVVTASKDKTARVWDVASRRSLMEFKGHTNEVYHASFSPDGRRIATAGHDFTVRIWDVGSGRTEIEWVVGTGFVNSVSFDPSGRYLLAACGDQTARVWSIEGGQIVAVLRGHEGGLNYAEFSPDGELIVTAGLDQTVRIWDFGTGRMLLQIPNPRGFSVTQASFSPDGKLLAVADVKGWAAVYACEICGVTGQELLDLARRRKVRELTPAERARYRVNDGD